MTPDESAGMDRPSGGDDEEGAIMKASLWGAALLLFCTTVAFGQDKVPMAKAELRNGQGELVGIATLAESANGVRVVAHVQNLPPGYHGFHIHEVGKCEPPAFKSAGEHFNPMKAEHGLANPKGPHDGDLLNLLVAPDGTGVIVTETPRLTLRTGQNSLFQAAGTALVIHAQPDDNRTDPTGGSGDRLACGVIGKATPGM